MVFVRVYFVFFFLPSFFFNSYFVVAILIRILEERKKGVVDFGGKGGKVAQISVSPAFWSVRYICVFLVKNGRKNKSRWVISTNIGKTTEISCQSTQRWTYDVWNRVEIYLPKRNSKYSPRKSLENWFFILSSLLSFAC